MLGKFLFPPRCAACRKLLSWTAPGDDRVRGRSIERALCSSCSAKWLDAEQAECGTCASPIRYCLCMPQSLKTARMHALFKLSYYVPRRREHVQNRVIYHIKESGEGRTPQFLAERLAPSIAETLRIHGISLDSCVVTYLPRSTRAVVAGGVDQSKNLAQALSGILGIPSVRLIRRRRGANRVQKQLSPEERVKNAKSAFLFAGDADCRGKTVLLVDDIVTTGAGMAACSRILYSEGARRVIGVTVAVDEINRDLGVKGLISRDSREKSAFFAQK